MGIFDFFTNTKRPQPGVPAIAQQDLKSKILSLNRLTAPFEIIDGQQEQVDLIAEWKIVDAQWYAIFEKAGLKKVFKIFLKFHPENSEVRALNQEYDVTWSAGVPNLGISSSAFSGQSKSFERGIGYAFKENLDYGQVYNYRFETSELVTPLQKIITESGWTYKGIVPPEKL